MSDNDFTGSSNFGTPFGALVEHCENRKLKFRANRTYRRIRMTLCGRHVIYLCRFHISDDDSVFQIYLTCPVVARSKEMRAAAAEFFSRVNYGLVIGNFEFDMRDGEMRYHVGHVISDGRLDDDTITRLISTALLITDQYFPAYTQLLFGGVTAEDTVFLAELDIHSDSVDDLDEQEKRRKRPEGPSPQATHKKGLPDLPQSTSHPPKKNIDPSSGRSDNSGSQ